MPIIGAMTQVSIRNVRRTYPIAVSIPSPQFSPKETIKSLTTPWLIGFFLLIGIIIKLSFAPFLYGGAIVQH